MTRKKRNPYGMGRVDEALIGMDTRHPTPDTRHRFQPVLGLILKGFPRISETFISNEILLLEALGFQIHIFSMRQPREPFSHDSVQSIRAKVDYLPESLLWPLPKLVYHNLRLAIRRPRVYLQTAAAAARRFLRTRKPATVKHLLQAGYLVERLLPGTGVVHLHAHFAHSPTSVAMFAAMLSGLRFSFTAHAKDIYTSDPRQLRDKLKLAEFAVTCTENNRRYLQALANGAPTPIYRVYHGIDIKLFSPPPKPPASRTPVRLLTVARLTPKKGLPTVFKAVRRLVDQGIAVEHTLIGDGEARDDVLACIDRLGLNTVTRWLGTQPHHVVLDHYARADVFVIGCEVARNGDRDGIPNVLIESMAMGVPVVATRAGSIAELVEDGRTGLLVPPDHPVEMADAIMRMITDPSFKKTVIRNGRRRVAREFDNKVLIADLAEIYRTEIEAFRQ